MSQLPASTFSFLKKLTKNNDREWFNAHKEEFLREQAAVIEFSDALLAEMQKHDHIETESGKKALYRIYRDTRFSKDKTPYKNHWSGSFSRATKILRGGYYFHLEPGNSFVGGGFWGPNPADLKRIRQEISYDSSRFRKILKSKAFRETFTELKGEQLTNAPQGYKNDHPDIDLLRYRQLLLIHKFSDKEVLAPDFYKTASATFRKMRPFFDLMSEILSTDANGISLH